MTKNNKTNIPVNKDGDLKPIPLKPTVTCNARLRYNTGYCQRLAGWETNHEGTGRCKDHGGLSFGQPRKAFSATELLKPEQTEILSKLETILETNPESIANSDNEITVLRSIFYEYLQKCKREQKLPNPNDLKKFTDCLAKMMEIKSKFEAKPNPKTVKANIFILYVNQINNILKKHIQDSNLLNSIADDLEKLSLPVEENGQ
jgi:hypothetical protein